MNGFPPAIYYPRCVVVLSCLFDDQVGGPGTPATFPAIPLSVEVNRNSARKADTCRLELDYRDFPLDPRIVQDIIVEVHMEDVRDGTAPLVPLRTNLRFIGRVDVPSTELGSNSQTVSMEARDYTGIWLDFRWPQTESVEGVDFPTLPTPPGITLQAVVELMKARVTPVLGPVVFTDPKAAASDVYLRTGRTTFISEDDDTAWDVLSALCDLWGLVPVFELDVLTIRTPTEPSTRSALLIYGQNVESLKFSRNLKQNKRKQVLIKCWNPVLGVAIDAEWPLPTHPDYNLVSRLSEAKVPVQTVQRVQYHIEGNYTDIDLSQIAQRVYTELSQNQVEGELETREMRDLIFGDSLLGLANGDLLICKLGTEDLASIASMSAAQAIAFLADFAKPGRMNPAAALALVDAWTAAQALSIKFYITETTHRWDRDEGYQLTVRFRDFVLGV
jgi:hypothetical protein